MAWGGIEPPTQGFSILAAFLSRQESKSHSPRSFGNDFGKKGQRLPLALLIPIDLAEKAGFEPAVGYKPTHAFQACDLNHSSISPCKRAIIRSVFLMDAYSASAIPPTTWLKPPST